MSDSNDMKRINPIDLQQAAGRTGYSVRRALGIPATTTVSAKSPPPLSLNTSVRVLPSTCPLGLCDGTGFYLLPMRFGHPDFGSMKPCDCRLLRNDQQSMTRRVQVLAALNQDMGDELAAATLHNYDLSRARDTEAYTTMAIALDTCRRYVAVPFGWIYLYGETGTGKSHLLAATARALVEEHNKIAVYTSELNLFRYLRDGYNRQRAHGDPDFIDADERMSELQQVDVLMLDDLGTAHRGKSEGPAGSWADAQIFDLLYERHAKERLTLLTSNAHVDDIDPRIRSRIHGRTSLEYAGRLQNLFVDNDDQRKGSDA